MTPQGDLSQVPPQVRVALHVQFLYLQAQQGGGGDNPPAIDMFLTSCRVITAYLSSEQPKPTGPTNPTVFGPPLKKRDMWAEGGPKMACGCPVGKCVGHAHGINGQPVIVPPQGGSGTAPHSQPVPGERGG